MLTLRTTLAVLALTCATVVTTVPASAGTSISVEINNRDRYGHHHDRYDRDRYHDRYDRGRHHRSHGHWRKRCYTDVDVRYRFGDRVRVVQRICFDRYGRPYVASRNYVRIGSRW